MGNSFIHGEDIYFPAGTYICIDTNFPFRQGGTPVTLLDCKNITIYGDGNNTILKTVSVNGADVLQLNGLKNISFRDMQLMAFISGIVSGSNGISITNGYDNIRLDLKCKNLPSLDKITYQDGGKALAIQPGTTVNECGILQANIIADGCLSGARFDMDLATMLTKNTSANINIIAENCYNAFTYSAGASTVAIFAGYDCGIKANITSINCQKDIVLGRMHGGEINSKVISTKTAIQLRLDPLAVAWNSTDTIVEALSCAYAKGSTILINGYKSDCDYKIRIGGTTAGLSGLNGFTSDCFIYLDIGGTAATANMLEINSGGAITRNCIITATNPTLVSYPILIANSVYNNTLTIGSATRLVAPTIAGALQLASGVDGTTITGNIKTFATVTGVQGLSNLILNDIGTGFYDKDGILRFGIRNGNGIVVDGLTASAVVGTYVGKQAVYDNANVLIGYFPIYT